MKQLFDFTRNCPRSEFWLVQLIGTVLAIVFLSVMGDAGDRGATGGVWLGLIALVAIMVAQLAALVSRIRDTGNNVLWLLACFIPYLGLIAWIIFGCLETKKA